MKDRKTGINHMVEVEALVPRRRDVTFGEVQETARGQAVEILRAAADALANVRLSELDEALARDFEERIRPIDASHFEQERGPAYRVDDKDDRIPPA